MVKDGLILIDLEPDLAETLVLTGDSLFWLKSWSPRPGSAVTLTSPSGKSWRGRVVSLSEREAALFVFEKMGAEAESGLEIVLLQALPDKERMELIIEKATELGADLIAPWEADKGVTLAVRESRQKKSRHWQRRALKAAGQCRRGRIPTVMPVTGLSEALDLALGAELKIIFTHDAERRLDEALAPTADEKVESVALLVGPEGGFSRREISAAKEQGFVEASLGPRILRTETAAIVAVSLIQFLRGDLGRW